MSCCIGFREPIIFEEACEEVREEACEEACEEAVEEACGKILRPELARKLVRKCARMLARKRARPPVTLRCSMCNAHRVFMALIERGDVTECLVAVHKTRDNVAHP